jgi:hypothetical protein
VVDLSVFKSYKYHLSGHTKEITRVLETNTILALFFHFRFARLCKPVFLSFNGEIALLSSRCAFEE